MTTPGRDVVTMHAVDVGYERPVVRDVDFRLRAGEAVAVVGPNGAGKSTLVRAVLGLVPVLAGRLELFGVPAEKFHQRYRIGYVPQRHTTGGAVPSTVREVVTSGRLPRMGLLGRPSAADRAAVDEALHTVGLERQATMPIARLSGGQQRRALIARALAAGPEVLVMDEPTAGVDVESQQALAGTLARLAGTGVTMLVVTHDLEPLAGVVTRAVKVGEGRLTELGPVDALVAHTHPGLDGHGHHHHHPDDPAGEPARAWLGTPGIGG
ncbi:MAG TPA: ATP-binding cassette domain-containing protein [Kineosporiaceae bacterium]|nr:ATP-binding cassette domain-containing protein [Kineosporiaceae bacterium]